ncbi:MAG TPA: von Willebrand factor type A domain-containing protein [Chthoniobacteraceae bacterium]|nr:von Willebrand factor type A domain-containing protein [Chthoniobacteraceae bacterium]
MNPDDPKLTAYALDELDAAERAEIEQVLREHPEAAAEVEATRTFAADLRVRLQRERAEPLHTEQRAEVLACMAAEHPRKFVAFPRRVAAWLALAACVLVGVGWALLFPVLNAMKQQPASDKIAVLSPEDLKEPKLRDGSEVQVTLGKDQLRLTEATPEMQRGMVIAGTEVKEVAPALASANRSANDYSLSLGVSVPSSTTAPVDRAALAKNTILAAAPMPNAGKDRSHDLSVQTGTVQTLSGTAAPAQQLNASLGDSTSTVALAEPASAVAEPARLRAVIEKSDPSSLAREPKAKSTPTALAIAPAKPAAKSAGASLLGANGGREKMLAERFSVGRTALGTENESGRPAVTTLAKDFYFKEASDRDGTEARRFYERIDKWRSGYAEAPGAESYEEITDNAFQKVTDAPLSTFSIDVDTASYANVRRFLSNNSLPPKAAVRIEELVNYFHYDYPQPDGETPFSAAMEVAACPWTPEHRLLRVALHGRDLARNARPASNLVFLIDVSGSMQPENKLPLLKRSLQLMVDQLGERDQVGIVVYAGAAGCVLTPTHSKQKIREALDRLESGGSTHGSAGLQHAYEMATEHFIKGGTNRVILATDGDWNVGVTDKNELWGMIEKKAKSGVFLTVLGFGMDNLKDDMLEKLADKGNGNYAYIDTLNEGRKVLVDELGATLVTIAKDVKIQIEFNPAQVAAYRLIGYENRVMAAKDFNDDTKDAGEIGAGHSVTAFYELVPAGKEVPSVTPAVEPLKYQAAPVAEPKPETRNLKLETSDELLTLKLRYKAPDADTSTLREFPLKDSGRRFENSSRDFRFGAAVVGYGMLLRGSPHKGSTNWELVHELAIEGKGDDRDGYRAEFVGLVERARALMR